MRTIDFYASTVQFFDHMLPIWHALPEEFKGTFYISEKAIERADAAGLQYTVDCSTEHLTLVASYSDYKAAQGPVIYMEHGIGNTYSDTNPHYAGGWPRDRVVLFLNQHHISYNKNHDAHPHIPGVVVGTPKMDNLPTKETNDKIVCISFHWDCHVCPETRSSFPHFKNVLPRLAKSKDFKLVMHGHPMEAEKFKAFAEEHNIPYIEKFEDVLKIADIYIIDNSSTLYEFAATGRPVIVLNSPHYRKNVRHGIRFWAYIPGVQVDDPMRLEQTIVELCGGRDAFKDMRYRITHALYPYKGEATQRAVTAITDYLTKGD